jgi:hypothetical protein
MDFVRRQTLLFRAYERRSGHCALVENAAVPVLAELVQSEHRQDLKSTQNVVNACKTPEAAAPRLHKRILCHPEGVLSWLSSACKCAFTTTMMLREAKLPE